MDEAPSTRGIASLMAGRKQNMANYTRGDTRPSVHNSLAKTHEMIIPEEAFGGEGETNVCENISHFKTITYFILIMIP